MDEEEPDTSLPVPDEGPLVFAFRFKDGAGVRTSLEDLRDWRETSDFVWVHLNAVDVETATWLGAEGLSEIVGESLLAAETRPRATTFDQGLMINMRGVNLNEGSDPEDMVSIRMWLTDRRLITTRRRRLKAVQSLRRAIEAGAPMGSPGAIVADIARRLATRMEPSVLEIEEEVDRIETAILRGEGRGARAQLADTRQAAVMLRRHIAPQRETLQRLASVELGLFDATQRDVLREAADQIIRFTEEIDESRERAMVLQDQLADARAEEMNEKTMLLSVVAAIFLPLGFLTGLLGINVGGMPGASNELAFWWVVGICLATILGLVIIFKRKKWL